MTKRQARRTVTRVKVEVFRVVDGRNGHADFYEARGSLHDGDGPRSSVLVRGNVRGNSTIDVVQKALLALAETL